MAQKIEISKIIQSIGDRSYIQISDNSLLINCICVTTETEASVLKELELTYNKILIVCYPGILNESNTCPRLEITDDEDNHLILDKIIWLTDIDKEFDEVFYQQEYPETLNFYQPFCTENNITERKRLFYHYKLYGSNNFQNLKEKRKSIFEPVVSTREPNDKLAVITTFFNPCNYSNIKTNYTNFSRQIEQCADLFPIELYLDDKPFIQHPNVIHIRGYDNNALWQKEALLNIALEKLPYKYTDVAWIDCDILFQNNSWVQETQDILEKYKICQLFSSGQRLKETNQEQFFVSLVKNYPHGVSGFAWAARREIIEQIKFLDNQILGGADYIMASAFMNKVEMLDKLLNNYIDNETTKKWIRDTIKVVDGSVGYLDSQITHMYHGSVENRHYLNRYDVFKDINYFSFTKEDIWSVNDKNLQDQILQYFYNRKEDDDINE
jgi:hypothetical protein